MVNPQIMLIDEAMMVTDNHFLNKVSEKTGLFKNPKGICIMATHAHELQATFCNKAIWLHKGRLIKVGPFKTVYKDYLKAKSEIKTYIHMKKMVLITVMDIVDE